MRAIFKESRVLPLYWMVLGALFLFLDYLTGVEIRLTVFFLIPVALAAWFSGRWWGIALAVLMPLVRLKTNSLMTSQGLVLVASLNALDRMLVFAAFALIVDRLAKERRSLARQVETLKGLLPICSVCKRIRTPENEWLPVESYISTHSEAVFSHGICPRCYREALAKEGLDDSP